MQDLLNFLLLVLLIPFVHEGLYVLEARKYFSVTEYGAVGDGKTDDTRAFLHTWEEACSHSREVPILKIPSGKTFLLERIIFRGPCKNYVRVEVDGNIRRPNQIWWDQSDHWIIFNRVNGISLVGSGEIDGQGASWWSCKLKNNCPIRAPNILAFLRCSKVQVWSLRLVNSPMMHMTVGSSVGVQFNGVKITSPGDSPNTDGIHIENSRHVIVTNSVISTGDDCVSIGSGAFDVNVSWVTCGPGHGISIGSLGAQNSRASVEKINVHDCNIYNTLTGVRIKTWQGGSGYARAITFANINITAARSPILIDQYYCNGGQGCPIQTSAVQVSDVTYYGVRGTSASDMAITFNCSQSQPCTNIKMEEVNIQPAGQGGKAEAICRSASGTQRGLVYPQVPCLSR